MTDQVERYAANVFLPGCLGPVKRDVVLEGDHDGAVRALHQRVEGLEVKNQHQLEEINILNGQLDKFRSQSYGIPALAEIERLRAALHSCVKASSAAGVGVIVDDALRDARAFTLEHDGGRAGVVRGRIDAALAEPCRLNMPALDEHLRYILGRPNFWCYSLANALRAMGQEIARKAEEEQAAVIHWLLKAYFEHGPGWREAVEKILAAEREKELAKGGDK